MKGKKAVSGKGAPAKEPSAGKESSGESMPPPPPPPSDKMGAKSSGGSYSQDDLILMGAMGILLSIGIALLFLLWREKNKIQKKECELKVLQAQMSDNSKYLDKVVETLESDKSNLEKEKSNKESALRIMEREIKQLNDRCHDLEVQLGKAKECCCKLTKETERIKQAKFGCDLMANNISNDPYQKHLQKKMERDRHCRPRCGEEIGPGPGPVLEGGSYTCAPNYPIQNKHFPEARFNSSKERKSRYKGNVNNQRPQSSARKESSRGMETQQTTSLTDFSDNGSDSMTYQSGELETTDMDDRKPARKWRHKSPEKNGRRSIKSEKNTKWQYLFLD